MTTQYYAPMVQGTLTKVSAGMFLYDSMTSPEATAHNDGMNPNAVSQAEVWALQNWTSGYTYSIYYNGNYSIQRSDGTFLCAGSPPSWNSGGGLIYAYSYQAQAVVNALNNLTAAATGADCVPFAVSNVPVQLNNQSLFTLGSTQVGFNGAYLVPQGATLLGINNTGYIPPGTTVTVGTCGKGGQMSNAALKTGSPVFPEDMFWDVLSLPFVSLNGSTGISTVTIGTVSGTAIAAPWSLSNYVATPGQGITSPNGNYAVVFRGDGAICLYYTGNNYGSSPTVNVPSWNLLWSTPKYNGMNSCIAHLDSNGDFHIQVAPLNYWWDAACGGLSGTQLVLLDDGTFGVYTAAGVPVWQATIGNYAGSLTTGYPTHYATVCADGNFLLDFTSGQTFLLHCYSTLATTEMEVWALQNWASGYTYSVVVYGSGYQVKRSDNTYLGETVGGAGIWRATQSLGYVYGSIYGAGAVKAKLTAMTVAEDGNIGANSVETGGANYAIGDTGTIAGSVTSATYTVTNVDSAVYPANDAVTSFTLSAVGVDYVSTAGATTTTSGSGSGFTVSFQAQSASIAQLSV